MELKVSSSKLPFPPSDCNSDPEEKEISEDDDDDRNHKHRRREFHSQSEETEAAEPDFSRPFRKRNRPFENGHFYGGGDSHLSETKFPRRRGMGSFSRAPSDSYQRMRPYQSLLGDVGNGRGRGAWGQRDSRFSSVDIASQMFPPGPITPGLFPGRGVQNVSNAQSSSWNAFGMVPGISNGALDPLHSLSFQGTLRPSLNPTMSMSIPRQRCRDFEERGFCLRGDMCPMEHGVNRIVVEDVQSLSQFNLPVSLPNAHILGPTGQGSLPLIDPSASSASGKVLHGRSSKAPVVDDGTDFYDPDQPLWSNDRPEASRALQDLNPPNVGDTEPGTLLVADSSDHDQVGPCDALDLERPLRGAKSASGPQSVWGRIRRSKNKIDVKEKNDSTVGASSFDEIRKGGTADPQMKESSFKPESGYGHNTRKPSQKALRTLFVRGIPQKDNTPDALLSHFRKFGEVIDIHIPFIGDRAFVQFSKREEAEAALKAPDAVMGNRFIKLLWANRDCIMDDGVNGGTNLPLTPRGLSSGLVPPYLSVPYKGKDNNIRSSATKTSEHSPVDQLPTSGPPKPVGHNGPTPAVQKKPESLELLKEELRKKQELLDQKRNEFRRRLVKLEKQAGGVKAETASDQDLKKQKEGETVSNSGKVETSSSTEPTNDPSSTHAEAISDSSRSAENAEHSCSISSSTVATREPSSLKQSIRPLAPHGAPFIFNRYKLDNRPTAFKVLPPMPSGLANVSILKEHFSAFGDLSSVELEDLEPEDGHSGSETLNISAKICFPTRRSAERAFSNGKIWQGQTLQFTWLPLSNSTRDIGVKKEIAPKQASDSSVQPVPKDSLTDSPEENAAGFKQASDSSVQPVSLIGSSEENAAGLKASDSSVQPVPKDSLTRSPEENAAGLKQASDSSVQPVPKDSLTGSPEENGAGLKQASDSSVPPVPKDSLTGSPEENGAGVDEPGKGNLEQGTVDEVPKSSSPSISDEKQVDGCDRS